MSTRAELLALRREVRAFLAEMAPPRQVDSWHLGYDPAFSRALAQRGWVGMRIPRRYGGSERSAIERFVVIEELLAAGAPVAAHWVGDRQTAPLLLHLGTEEQRERFLPAIARAELGFAIGMSEPDSGSDLASIRTRAERVEGGWVLNGTKVWMTHGHLADYAQVLCRTSREASRHDGLSQMLLNLRAPGVVIRPIPAMFGEASFCEVALDDAFVADEHVLGRIGRGWEQVMLELGLERSGPERFLSTQVLLGAFADVVHSPSPATEAGIGRMVAELAALHLCAFETAYAQEAGVDPGIVATLGKEAGPAFEQAVVELVRTLRAREPSARSSAELGELVDRARLLAPAFTLRGGTTEVMRTVLARQVMPGV